MDPRGYFLLTLIAVAFISILPGRSFCSEEEILLNRIVAGVNDDIVTLYDLELAAKWNGKIYDAMTLDEKKMLVDQLINRILILQEVNRTKPIFLNDGVVRKAVNSIKKQRGAEFISEKAIETYVRTQFLISEFTRRRFEPLVRISPTDIRNYYNTEFATRIKDSGKPLPSLNEVRNSIEVLLKEKEINRQLKEWLDREKASSRIVINNY